MIHERHCGTGTSVDRRHRLSTAVDPLQPGRGGRWMECPVWRSSAVLLNDRGAKQPRPGSDPPIHPPSDTLPAHARRPSPSSTQGGSRMQEICSYGSVRRARRKARPYRDSRWRAAVQLERRGYHYFGWSPVPPENAMGHRSGSGRSWRWCRMKAHSRRQDFCRVRTVVTAAHESPPAPNRQRMLQPRGSHRQGPRHANTLHHHPATV